MRIRGLLGRECCGPRPPIGEWYMAWGEYFDILAGPEIIIDNASPFTNSDLDDEFIWTASSSTTEFFIRDNRSHPENHTVMAGPAILYDEVPSALPPWTGTIGPTLTFKLRKDSSADSMEVKLSDELNGEHVWLRVWAGRVEFGQNVTLLEPFILYEDDTFDGTIEHDYEIDIALSRDVGNNPFNTVIFKIDSVEHYNQSWNALSDDRFFPVRVAGLYEHVARTTQMTGDGSWSDYNIVYRQGTGNRVPAVACADTTPNILVHDQTAANVPGAGGFNVFDGLNNDFSADLPTVGNWLGMTLASTGVIQIPYGPGTNREFLTELTIDSLGVFTGDSGFKNETLRVHLEAQGDAYLEIRRTQIDRLQVVYDDPRRQPVDLTGIAVNYNPPHTIRWRYFNGQISTDVDPNFWHGYLFQDLEILIDGVDWWSDALSTWRPHHLGRCVNPVVGTDYTYRGAREWGALTINDELLARANMSVISDYQVAVT